MTGDRLIREALFSDGTENYRMPMECDAGDEVRIRFRTAKDNAESVALIFAEAKGDEEQRMEKVSSDAMFDYYETSVTVGTERIQYYFEVTRGEEICAYTRLGADGGVGSRFYFTITPGFHIPKWMQGCVMYQIFTDRFANGDSANNVRSGEYQYLNNASEEVTDWYAPTRSLDVGRFYGGDLKGVLEKIPYLKELGVEAIYFNPIFVSPSNHKYDCQDYEHIDPHYAVIVKDGDYRTRSTAPENLEASDRFFAEMVKQCHENGIRVIVDGVFNHCGSFNKMMNREKLYRAEDGYAPGAYECADSPYHSYFKFADERPEAWPDNAGYEQWWGNDTLPKLNYEESPELEAYILGVGRKWVSAPYGVDGWRLDVAADLGHSEAYNHSFWKKYRQAVKEANPDAVIFAEHYGDPNAWLLGDEWDTIMNYDAFMEPVTWFLTGMEKHSDAKREDLYGNAEAFFRTMKHAQCAMQTGSILTAMNELSNHDHSRFLTRTNRMIGRLDSRGYEAASEGVNFGIYSAAVVIQMTWPGAPTIYYGDEAGVCGWTDPDSRRTYPWGRENHQMLDFHTYMVELHKHDVFRYGSWKELYAANYLIAYGRMHGDHVAVTVVNAGECTIEADIPVWQLGVTDDMTLSRVMSTDATRYNVGLHHRGAKNGYLHCRLKPFASKVYISWAADEHNVRWVDRDDMEG